MIIPPDHRLFQSEQIKRCEQLAVSQDNPGEHDSYCLTEKILPIPLAARKKNSHKADFGHVLVIGGGQGMPGAAALAAKAALRTGAGSASIAAWPYHINGMIAVCPEVMIFGVTSEKNLQPLLSRASVCVLGPGLGEDEWAQSLYHAALASQLPMIIDASALRLLSCHPQMDDNWILTPHPGEAASLLSCSVAEVQKNRFHAASELQQRYGGVIVLKGHGSIVRSTEGQTFVCPSGNPGMASAGMGDVLSGIIAGLVAQGLSLSEAAKTAVWLHARAGDMAAKITGQRGLLASDLFSLIPKLLNGKTL